MKRFPIRVRLTFWYGSLLSAGLLAFSLFMVGALHHAMHRTVDNQLRDHMGAIQQIVNEDRNQAETVLQHDLDEDVELAPDLTLLGMWDRDGRVVYRSSAMNRMKVPASMPQPGHEGRTRSYHDHPLRMLVREISAPGHEYVVMVAVPVRDFVEAMGQVENTLWIAIPLLLLLAIGGGYWIANRALAPIVDMIAAADAIHPGDLATRLRVPAAEDELQGLALTLNRMLDRLQAGFERLTRFTADASHELRTPIALLRTRTEVLLRRARSPEEYRDGLESSLHELEKTSVLLDELLLLARADAGAESLHFAPLNLCEIVSAAAAVMRPLAEARQLGWSVSLPKGPVTLQGDEAALRRLLLILIDNAVKYTPAQGAIGISLEPSGQQAIVEVRDTGIGIAEEDISHVFERFYRADPARTRATGGAGLGLSIGQWIVRLHGGKLTVQSTVASGSVFRVTLPILSPQPIADTVSGNIAVRSQT